MTPPRDPAAFSPSPHFLERFEATCGPLSATRRDPPITGRVVRACVEDGDFSLAKKGRHKYTATIDGHRWVLVVELNPDGNGGEAVTAFVPGVHTPHNRGGGE